MSIYPSPKTRNGTLNTIFNKTDYIQTNTGGGSDLNISQTDAKYLQISGVTSSSAQTTFQNTVDFKSSLTVDNITSNTLGTFKDLTVSRLLKSTTLDTLTAEFFRTDQVYSFNNGMVYSIISDATTVNSVTSINIPTNVNKSYIFTFILQSSTPNSPYYIKPSSHKINVNGAIIDLYGLNNVSLPANYTFLVQQISIIYDVYYGKQFFALTSVSAYSAPSAPPKVMKLIAGGSGGNTIALSSDNGVSWTLPNNQPFTSQCYGRSAFDGKRIVIGGNSNIAYSDDYGITWISTGFASITIVYQIIYIPETQIWFAVGNSSSNQTMARSSDGINWTLLSSTIFERERQYNIIYNGSVYIACGWSNSFPMATSLDGFTWEYNTNYKFDTTGLQAGYCLIFDGSRYIFAGGASPSSSTPTSSNIVISQDGITWDDTNNIYLPFDIRSIAYNGVDTYVACGEKKVFIDGAIFSYWSNDLINWTRENNNLIGNAWFMDWNGTYFVITGRPLSGSTVNVIYSTDGKNWSASDNTQFTSDVWGVSSISY